jgi:hypothetical protein
MDLADLFADERLMADVTSGVRPKGIDENLRVLFIVRLLGIGGFRRRGVSLLLAEPSRLGGIVRQRPARASQPPSSANGRQQQGA